MTVSLSSECPQTGNEGTEPETELKSHEDGVVVQEVSCDQKQPVSNPDFGEKTE